MFCQNISYGVALISGNGYRCYTLEITGGHHVTKLLAKKEVKLAKNHKKGGQSALRIARTAVEKEMWYVKEVTDVLTQIFLREKTEYLIEGMIIAGYGDIYKKVMEEDLFQQYFKNRVIKVMTVNEITDSTIGKVYEDCFDLLETKEKKEARKMVQEVDTLIKTDFEKLSIGVEEVLSDLKDKMLCKVIHTEKLSQEVRDKIKELLDYHCQMVEIPSEMSQMGSLLGIKW